VYTIYMDTADSQITYQAVQPKIERFSTILSRKENCVQLYCLYIYEVL